MAHLLIVDHDPQTRLSLARALKAQGQRTTAADMGSLAAAIAVHSPDIVLLNIPVEAIYDAIASCRWPVGSEHGY